MKNRNLLLAFVAFVAIAFTSCTGGTKSSVKIETEADTVAYALGNSIGNSVKQQFGEVNPEIIAKAIIDAYEGTEDSLFANPQDADTAIRNYMQRSMTQKGETNKVKGEEFLAENAKKDGITVTESGLQYEVMTEGTGEKPVAESTVKVHYHGTTIDGEVFDSSVDRGEPVEFPLNGVIAGWTEGVQLMSIGSKYRFFIPSELAYGERGAGGSIGPNSALIFEVELLEIVK